MPEMLRHEQMGIFTFLKLDRMGNSEFQQLSGDWAGLTSDESVLRRETLAFVFGTLRGPKHGVGISYSFPFFFLRFNYDIGNQILKIDSCLHACAYGVCGVPAHSSQGPSAPVPVWPV